MVFFIVLYLSPADYEFLHGKCCRSLWCTHQICCYHESYTTINTYIRIYTSYRSINIYIYILCMYIMHILCVYIYILKYKVPFWLKVGAVPASLSIGQVGWHHTSSLVSMAGRLVESAVRLFTSAAEESFKRRPSERCWPQVVAHQTNLLASNIVLPAASAPKTHHLRMITDKKQLLPDANDGTQVRQELVAYDTLYELAARDLWSRLRTIDRAAQVLLVLAPRPRTMRDVFGPLRQRLPMVPLSRVVLFVPFCPTLAAQWQEVAAGYRANLALPLASVGSCCACDCAGIRCGGWCAS